MRRAHSVQLLGKAALTTYQGMAGALETWTPTFMPLLQIRLHELMEQIGRRHLRVGRWVAIAIRADRERQRRGQCPTRKLSVPRIMERGKPAKYRKKKTKGLRRRKNAKAKSQPQAPQIWITMMWHTGLGLPWCWKTLGPSNASERQHVKDLIHTGHFLKNTLFVGDAGFVGYEFWKLIIDQKHDFYVRIVGGNVRLLMSLGFYTKEKKGIVYCWPNAAMSDKQPPLVLHLVKCRIGRKPVHLLTSVLDESKLSCKEIKTLYERRWGVELKFAHSNKPLCVASYAVSKSERALVGNRSGRSLGWPLIELFALKEQLEATPTKRRPLSFCKIVRERFVNR